MKLTSLDVAIVAITAALYTALGYIFQPISFLELQFRVAELMVGMTILFPIPGLIGKVKQQAAFHLGERYVAVLVWVKVVEESLSRELISLRRWQSLSQAHPQRQTSLCARQIDPARLGRLTQRVQVPLSFLVA